jgi:hypothetical protein
LQTCFTMVGEGRKEKEGKEEIMRKEEKAKEGKSK